MTHTQPDPLDAKPEFDAQAQAELYALFLPELEADRQYQMTQEEKALNRAILTATMNRVKAEFPARCNAAMLREVTQ